MNRVGGSNFNPHFTPQYSAAILYNDVNIENVRRRDLKVGTSNRRLRKCLRALSRFMMKLEPKKMPLFQRGILGLLFIVCVLLVIVLLPVSEKRSDEFLFKRNKAVLGRPYNSTYPLTPPTSESVCLLSAQSFAYLLES